MRLDHWVKNLLIGPGVFLALLDPQNPTIQYDTWTIILGLLSLCIVSSANYVLNEILDAETDKYHPTKKYRPIASNEISIAEASYFWLCLSVIGICLAALVNSGFLTCVVGFWVMGFAYNAPPVRLKDKPYVDILAESINNPLRMLAGWYLFLGTLKGPNSFLLFSFWSLGAFFMTLKRYSEFRNFENKSDRSGYRKSFALYSEGALSRLAHFYAVLASGLFAAGAFEINAKLLFAFPFFFVSILVAIRIAKMDSSQMQFPETLFMNRELMAPLLCGIVTAISVSLQGIGLVGPFDSFLVLLAKASGALQAKLYVR